MDRLELLSKKIRNLFSDEKVTVINAKDFLTIHLNEWQYINEGRIRFKIVEKTKDHVVSVTEWLEDDIYHKHYHEDSHETIFVIAGRVTSLMDPVIRQTFGKISYKKGTIHEVEAKKGTLIAVKFDFA